MIILIVIIIIITNINNYNNNDINSNDNNNIIIITMQERTVSTVVMYDSIGLSMRKLRVLKEVDLQHSIKRIFTNFCEFKKMIKFTNCYEFLNTNKRILKLWLLLLLLLFYYYSYHYYLLIL